MRYAASAAMAQGMPSSDTLSGRASWSSLLRIPTQFGRFFLLASLAHLHVMTCRESIFYHSIPNLFASPIGHDCLAPILILVCDLLSSSPHGPVVEVDITLFTLVSQISMPLHAMWVTSADQVLSSRTNVKANSLTQMR